MTKASANKDERDVNPTAASLLGFLGSGEMSGYELVQLAELVIGPFWSLTRSQVYRELANLSERGLVVEGAMGARSRRPYRITPAGRRAFKLWLEQTPGPEQIRYPLLLTMSFGASLGADRLMAMVREHRPLHEQRLATYEEDQASFNDPYLRSVVAFGVHYERAVLAWMDQVPGLLGVTDDAPT